MKKQLSMYEEDLLRSILEFGDSDGLNIQELLVDINGEKNLFDNTVNNLEIDGLITHRGSKIALTHEGKSIAEKIYSKHKYIEEYFREVFNEKEVHVLAHALEHCVSDSILARMRGELALIREKSRLSDLMPGDKAIVLAISVGDKKLFSRILGLGLFPSVKVRVFESYKGQMVLEVDDRKIALDKVIAEKVLISKQNNGVDK
jgi:Mn-dependent DtxR family transcriptional regulator/Fe2+ transport system protein FeoA